MKKITTIFLMMILFGILNAQTPNIVISGVYGGGGNSGSTYKNDYIELYNTTNSAVDLAGYTLYYASAAGNSATSTNYYTFPAGSTIGAKKFALIKAAQGAGSQPEWPITFDFNGSGAGGGNLAMSATDGKVLLLSAYHNLTASGSIPTTLAGIQAMANYVDYVPYGTATPKFGADLTGLSASMAAKRKYNDATKVIDYTLSVGADFDKVTANENAPRNSSYGNENQVATPTFSPAGGTYTSPQTVTITCTTPDANILYTLDGSNPSMVSPIYTTPITVSFTTTIKAMAFKAGMDNSSIATAVYNFPVIVDVPNIAAFKATPESSTIYKITGDVTFVYRTGRYMFIKDETAGLMIFDNATPIITTTYNNGDIISGGIIGTHGVFNGLHQLVPSVNTATGTPGATVLPKVVTMAELLANFATYESQLLLLESVIFDAGTFGTGAAGNINIHQGSDEMICRNHFGNITGYETDPSKPYHVAGFAIPYNADREICPRSVDDIFLPGSVVATPEFSPAGGYYEEPVQVTITTTTEGAEIRYTTDGSEPTQTSTLFTAPISVSKITTIKARAFHPDFNPSIIVSATYQFPGVDQVAKPTFTPESGSYADVSVTINCATPGASIYYTLNGNEPTEQDMLFEEPIEMPEGTTILKAKAFKTGMDPSVVATASYIVEVGIEEWNAQIKICPNPTSGELRIKNEELRIENVEVFDVYGRKILSHASLLSSETIVNISHLPAGVYFVKITTDVGEIVKKVVKK